MRTRIEKALRKSREFQHIAERNASIITVGLVVCGVAGVDGWAETLSVLVLTVWLAVCLIGSWVFRREIRDLEGQLDQHPWTGGER